MPDNPAPEAEMFLQSQLDALLRDGSRGVERHDARNLQRSWRKFAAFAYVTEQYGYRYEGLSPLSPKGSPNPYFAFRRMPNAVEQAGSTAERYPTAAQGGQLPGMRPGGSRLRPLPETQRDVDLLRARIMVDYSRTHRRRGLIALIVIPFVMLIPLSQTGFTFTALVVCAAIWLVFAALWALGLSLARRRYAKYSQILRAAGVQWPPSTALT
uniref:Integral membrane protein n=1 Tax=Streptomyces sp. NBC_01393 TaxID=2903851 RepID=A0AAU3HTP5_9ACTN